MDDRELDQRLTNIEALAVSNNEELITIKKTLEKILVRKGTPQEKQDVIASSLKLEK